MLSVTFGNVEEGSVMLRNILNANLKRVTGKKIIHNDRKKTRQKEFSLLYLPITAEWQATIFLVNPQLNTY